MSPKGKLKTPLTAAGALLFAAAALVLGLLSFAQTGAGRAMIASRLSALLSMEPGRVVSVEGLEGFLPFRVRIRAVTVSDPEGAWLVLRDSALIWSPAALLQGRIRIKEISAASVSLDRLPSRVSKEEEEQPFSLPEGLPRVTVGRLHVGEFALGAAVAGQTGHFGVEGSLVETGSGPWVTAFLKIQRKDDGPRLRVDIEVTPRSTPPSVEVRAEVEEAEGGILSALLGMAGAGEIRLAIQGEGPPSSWKGSVQGGIGRLGAIETEIIIEGERDKRVCLNGSYVSTPSLFRPELAAILGHETRFQVVTRTEDSNRLVLENAELNGAGYRIQLEGKIQLESQEVDARWTMGIDDVGVFTALLGMPLGGELSARGIQKGTISRPKGSIHVQLEKLRAAKLRAGEVATELGFESVAATGSSFPGLRISGKGSAVGLSAAENGKPLPESSLEWTVDADLMAKGAISVNAFTVKGKDHQIDVKGRVDASGRSGSLDSVIAVKDMRTITALLGEEVPGSARLAVHAKADAALGSASGTIEGHVTGVPEGTFWFGPLLGPELTLDGSFELRDKSRITVSALRLESAAMKLNGMASADLSGRRVEGKWRLSLPDLKRFEPAAGKPLGGSIEAEGTLGGTPEAIESISTARGSSIAFNGRSFGQMLSRMQLRGIPSAPEGSVGLEIAHGDQKLDASTDFRLDKGKRELTLSKVALNAPGGKLGGQAAVDLGKGTAKGSIEAVFKDLRGLGRILGERLAGNAELRGSFAPVGDGQNVDLTARATGLETRYGKIGTVSLAADLKNVLAAPRGSLDVQLKEFVRPGLAIRSAGVKAAGDGKGIDFDVSAGGRSSEEFDFETRGAFSRTGEVDRVRVVSLHGRFGEYPLKLMQSLEIERSNKMVELRGVSVAVGQGRLQASGRSGGGSIFFTGEFQKLPLGLLSIAGGPELSGLAGGSMKLEGAVSGPIGTFDLRLSDVRPSGEAYRDVHNISLSAGGKLQAGRLGVNFEVERQSEKPARGNLSLPVNFSIAPAAFSVPMQGELQGHLEAKTDLETLSAVVPLEGHRLSGGVEGAFDLRGTIAKPEIGGRATVRNGTYENFNQGTVLRNLMAEMSASGSRIEIPSLRATDGGRGTVTASGAVSIDTAGRFPFELKGALSKAALVRRDDLTAAASGTFVISGSLSEMTLGGKLEVDSAEYILPKRSAPPMAELKVIEVHAPGQKAASALPQAAGEARGVKTGSAAVAVGEGLGRNKAEGLGGKAAEERKPEPPVKLTLDLGLRFPGRTHVRGRGLDSEWEGTLQTGGTANRPSLVGDLKVVRGRYDFLGERFNITEGIIRFYGTSPPAPTIQATAEAKAEEVTARLILSGPISAPAIQLESSPPLPSDEILARVLFDRKLSQISPLQAVRLANAVRVLSGRGDAFDLMDRARGILHVDQLDLRGSEENKGEYNLGVGKYLTDDLYVDVEKGVGSNSGKLSVEFEITPNITLESEAGMDSGKGVGLNWKLDY